VNNISRIKKATKTWVKAFHQREKAYFIETESRTSSISESKPSEFFLEEEKTSLRNLEETHQALLVKEEHNWCLKIRPLWIHEGDNNTKLFHHFANHRKWVNTIWELKTIARQIISTFAEKS